MPHFSMTRIEGAFIGYERAMMRSSPNGPNPAARQAAAISVAYPSPQAGRSSA